MLSTFCLTLSATAFSQNVIDIGVYGLVAPLAPHTGAANKSVIVKIRNYGSVAITSIKVGWKINGIAQPNYSQFITIPAASSANQIPTANVTLSTTFTDVAGKSFEFYTIEANNQTDADALNVRHCVVSTSSWIFTLS